MADLNAGKPGTNTILMGPTGTGKTYSIRTLVDAGVTPFILATEPGVPETLRGFMGDPGAEGGCKIHLAEVMPQVGSFKEAAEKALKFGTLNEKMLSSSFASNKEAYTKPLQSLYATLMNFKCRRCGQEFGAVDDWGNDRALVIDGLSGLNQMCLDNASQGKALLSISDWGKAINSLLTLNYLLTTGTQCHYVLIAHVSREYDEVTGAQHVTLEAVGKKAAPQLPKNYSDVILAVRRGTKFHWSTGSSGVDTKCRNLPLGTDLEPSFVPLLDAWRQS